VIIPIFPYCFTNRKIPLNRHSGGDLPLRTFPIASIMHPVISRHVSVIIINDQIGG